MRIAERAIAVEVVEDEAGLRATIDGESVELRAERGPDGRLWVVGLGDHSFQALAEVEGDRVTVALDGEAFEARLEDERLARLVELAGGRAWTGGERTVRAPMPGLVLRVNVAPGEAVEKGASLLAIQAMKMENEIVVPEPGRVREVKVSAGATVEQGQVLVVLE